MAGALRRAEAKAAGSAQDSSQSGLLESQLHSSQAECSELQVGR